MQRSLGGVHMYKALGFDLDNTLYNQSQHFELVFKHAASMLAIKSGLSEDEVVHRCMAHYEL